MNTVKLVVLAAFLFCAVSASVVYNETNFTTWQGSVVSQGGWSDYPKLYKSVSRLSVDAATGGSHAKFTKQMEVPCDGLLNVSMAGGSTSNGDTDPCVYFTIDGEKVIQDYCSNSFSEFTTQVSQGIHIFEFHAYDHNCWDACGADLQAFSLACFSSVEDPEQTDSSEVEVQVEEFVSIGVSTTQINLGILKPGQTSDPKQIIVKNLGNVPVQVKAIATTLVDDSTGRTISTEYLEVNTDYLVDFVSLDSEIMVEDNLDWMNNFDLPVNIRVSLPDKVAPGNYTATITFIASAS